MTDRERFRVAVGRLIRAHREAYAVSQEVLARELGITQASISNYENGKRDISFRALSDVALFFEAPLASFVEEVRREYDAPRAESGVAA